MLQHEHSHVLLVKKRKTHKPRQEKLRDLGRRRTRRKEDNNEGEDHHHQLLMEDFKHHEFIT
jgi:hypothetical protein